MLFDLRGKRRRTVQATYLTLAVLMGAGLVLFGIGSSTSGGLGDLFKGGNGSSKADETQKKQIAAAEKTLAVQPKNHAALGQLIAAHYRLALTQADQNGNFLPKAKPELQQAGAAWNRYLDTNPSKPDSTAVNTALQTFHGLAQMSTGAEQKTYFGDLSDVYGAAAQLQPNLQNYLFAAQYATAAGKTAIAQRAITRAESLAPKSKRKQVPAAAKQPPPEAQGGQPQPVQGSGG